MKKLLFLLALFFTVSSTGHVLATELEDELIFDLAEVDFNQAQGHLLDATASITVPFERDDKQTSNEALIEGFSVALNTQMPGLTVEIKKVKAADGTVLANPTLISIQGEATYTFIIQARLDVKQYGAALRRDTAKSMKPRVEIVFTANTEHEYLNEEIEEAPLLEAEPDEEQAESDLQIDEVELDKEETEASNDASTSPEDILTEEQVETDVEDLEEIQEESKEEPEEEKTTDNEEVFDELVEAVEKTNLSLFLTKKHENDKKSENLLKKVVKNRYINEWLSLIS